jgi:hypothetical protein
MSATEVSFEHSKRWMLVFFPLLVFAVYTISLHIYYGLRFRSIA